MSTETLFLPSSRRNFVFGVLLLALVGLLVRAAYLQVYDQETLANKAERRQIRTLPIPAHRGRLLDRNGEALAVSTPIWSVWVDPSKLEVDAARWGKLAKTLGTTVDALNQRIASTRSRRFVYLARSVAPNVSEAVEALRIKGVGAMQQYRRYYPASEVTAHLLGFTDIDDKGQEGLEGRYDSVLKGTPGRIKVQRDGKGYAFNELEILEEATPGNDMVLSIDQRIQYLAYRELKKGVQKHGAKSGSIVVVDVNTGEILALANQPSYNPNDVSQRRGSKQRNRAVTDMFEPGSTMKTFTIAAALESGKFNPTDIINTSPGHITIGGYTIKDARDYGRLPVSGIIKKSSNVGSLKIALSMEKQLLWDTFHRFGFGQSTYSTFPGEAEGRLREVFTWGKVEQAATSYGYGLSVTMLQLARAYSAIAADGWMPDELSFFKLDNPPTRTQVISAKSAKRLQRMLESVTDTGGTGQSGQVAGFRVAAKTGTTRISSKGGYELRYISHFAGFAPVTQPALAVIVKIKEPSRGGYYGGVVAGPVFSAVMSGALRILGTRPDGIALAQGGS